MSNSSGHFYIKLPGGHFYNVAHIRLESEGSDIFLACDPMYDVSEGLLDEAAVRFLEENKEPVRLGLPHGAVWHARVSVEGKSPEVVLACTPSDPPVVQACDLGGSWGW